MKVFSSTLQHTLIFATEAQHRLPKAFLDWLTIEHMTGIFARNTAVSTIIFFVTHNAH